MPDTTISAGTIRVSVVVPLYNEMPGLPLLRNRLAALHSCLKDNFQMELCLVDDGSLDGTGEHMASVVPQNVNVISLRHNRNRGIGAAIRTGLNAAQGEIVCTIDSDCSYPPEELQALIEQVHTGDTDVAVASPYHPQGSVLGVPFWRLLLSKQCSRLYRWISPLKLYTYTSIFRAYGRHVLHGLEFQSNGFVSAVEILHSVHRRGFRVAEVPMTLRARSYGTSKIRIASTVLAHLAVLCRIQLGTFAATPLFRSRQRAPSRIPRKADLPAAFSTIERNHPAS